MIYVKDELSNLIATYDIHGFKYFATALVLLVFLANNFCIHYEV